MSYFETGTYRLQSANTSWDYETDGNRMRFEVRSGDHWQNDRSGVERSEIASYKKLAIGQTYTISYKFMVEPGQPNTADWLVLGQLHSTEDSYDSGVSPPSGINLIGERMEIHVRWSTPAQTNWDNVKTRSLYTDTHDIQRGHWYDIKMTVKFDPFGNGILDVWRDGVQLVNYRGPLGYNDQIGPYWKHGVYREASPESMAVNYSDFSLVEGAATDRPPTDPAPGGTVNGTTGDDVLHGTGVQDSIHGGDGSDHLYG
ncbi:MAG: heparin lyase I family protein [Microvirga sp.]